MSDTDITNDLICDDVESVAFLTGLYPKDIAILSASWPLGIPGKPKRNADFFSKSFYPEQIEEMKAWISSHNNAGYNIYFSINPVKQWLESKATKNDILEARRLFVDMDPRPGEDIAEERSRAHLLLTTKLPAGILEPSIIIDSGGGFWGLWEIFPEPVDGYRDEGHKEGPLTEAVEDRGRGLEQAFPGADKCRNIDRICRLPGTINWPDKKKLAKGRKPAKAKLLKFDLSLKYKLSDFPEVRNSAEPKAGLPQKYDLAAIDDDLGVLDKYNIPERIKTIIKLGQDPDKAKKGDISRSGWLWFALLALLRSAVPDEVVYSIITDARFGISAHILDKKKRAHEYARKQIAKARLLLQDPQQMQWTSTTQEGNPLRSFDNTIIAILKLGITCQYDTFHDRFIIGGQVVELMAGELTDGVCAVLRKIIFDRFGFDPAKNNIYDATSYLCHFNAYNPVVEMFDGLEWDGVERLSYFLSKYLGAEDTLINRFIGRIMLIAAVRRARHPGTKFDTIVVLEGKQGTGKSSALVILAGRENFSDQPILTLDTKAQREAVRGILIYELCELEGLGRAEINKVKAFASRQDDRARPAYGRFLQSQPRTCIFVGTTNEDEYLRDNTGNRRFLPVKTGDIDLDALIADRDQLWAEAAYYEAQGESITLPQELWDEAAAIQKSRVEHDPWIDILMNISAERVNGHFRITPAEIFQEYLLLPKEKWTNALSKRLAAAMRQLGWEGPGPARYPSGMRRAYTKPIPPGEPEIAVKDEDDIPF